MEYLNKIHHGDCRDHARTMAAAGTIVNTIITSPPYWAVREYGIAPSTWVDGWTGTLGNEPDPRQYCAHMVEVFESLRDLLAPDGSMWVNLGDTWNNNRGRGFNSNSRRNYRDNNTAVRRPPGFKRKDLIGIPWLVAFALREAGWYLRQGIVWNKPNGMPSSCTDRCSNSHEYIFLLSKKPKYYYDRIAIMEPQSETERTRRLREQKQGLDTTYDLQRNSETTGQVAAGVTSATGSARIRQEIAIFGMRNKRSVWTQTTKPYRGSHTATYPPDLVKPCVLASTSERGHCPVCGAGWKRIWKKGRALDAWRKACGADTEGAYSGQATKDYAGAGAQNASAMKARILDGMREIVTVGWEPTCKHVHDEPVPGIVYDPFAGTGATGEAAETNGRLFVGSDMNENADQQWRDRRYQLQLRGVRAA